MNSAATLMHVLDRTVTIGAPPQTVFRYFTNVDRWAAWWGKGSTIDPRPGGPIYIRYPDGTEVSGEVVEVAAPDRIVFTYGFKSGKPIPPGASRVTIKLAPTDEGTRLTLAHEFADSIARDEHVQGWRYQLSLFANVVADEVNASAAQAVDAWFGAWAITDASERAAALQAIAAPALTFRDRFGSTNGIDDLVPHIGAAQHFMPGMLMTRDGAVRHCQGTVLANWKATGSDGQTRGTGTNVFSFDAEGKIRAVAGFWNL
jgi:uncharacterized protein YndB with AHSA1/START domain